MKILKERGNHLDDSVSREQDSADSMRILAVILSIVGIIGAIWGIYVNNIIMIFIFAFLLQFSWKTYKKSAKNVKAYKKGILGEDAVTSMLKNLNDSYYLINDVTLPNSYGNIDHIVLGPNGIFVIETKNYEGTIINNGDEWSRRYKSKYGHKDYAIASISKQAKRNAVTLKNFLSDIIKGKNYFVNSAIVFTSENIDLQLNDPTVTILKLDELPNYIMNFKGNRSTQGELESIAEAIMAK